MECALFACLPSWREALPEGVLPVAAGAKLPDRLWDLLVLTPEGCRLLGDGRVRCREVLVPGDCCPALLRNVETETVVSYGLSHRDSLTFSSLTEPVLCVQRVLPRPDGGVVEPQEFPLPVLPCQAETLLPLLGMRLLQMPLTKGLFSW